MPGEKFDEELTGGEKVLGGSTYLIYMFVKGTFVLKGDGGFHNFCVGGNYIKHGNRYKFNSMEGLLK